MAVSKTEDLEAQWYAEMEEKARGLDEETSGLASMVIGLSRLSYLGGQEDESKACMERLWTLAGGWTEQIYEPLLEAVRKLFSPYTAGVMNYIVGHCTEYPYSRGYARRPYRTRSLALHSAQILSKLSSLILMERHGFVLGEYLRKKDNDTDYNESYRFKLVLSDVIACELDREDSSEMLEILKEMVYGDNQAAVLSFEVIKGVFMSHRQEAVVMLGELLLAARLQEGLRQSLVERMDEGTLDNNLYMLKLILDNDFVRYSSVVRALGVWTGMGLEAQNQRVAKSLIEGAYLVLTDEAVRTAWLEDANAHHVYLSLWATAVYEEEDLYGRIETLMAKGQLYQRIVAQYVLANSQHSELRLESARQSLEEQDLELQYWVLTNYSYGYSRLWRPDKNGPKLDVQRSPQLEDKEARQRDFTALKAMFLRAPQRELTIESKVLNFVQVNYTPELPVRKMLYLTAYDMDNSWIAELIALKDELTPDLRGELLASFISDPLDPVQREFVFASLGDKSMKNRELALEQAKEWTLDAEELVQAEALLKLKTGSLRQNVTRLLLNQPDAALEGSIGRLLQVKNGLQRLAALEMVTVLFEDEQRSGVYETVRPWVEAIAEPAAKERELIAKLGRRNEYTAASGFGLFNPDETEPWLTRGPQPGAFRWEEVFSLPVEEIRTFLQGLDEQIHEQRDTEYVSEFYSGQKETLLIGALLRTMKWVSARDREDSESLLEEYPLHELWSAYLEQSGWNPRMLLELNFYILLEDLDDTLDRYFRYYRGSMDYQEMRKHKLLEGWRAEFTEQIYPLQTIREVTGLLDGLRYGKQAETLIRAFYTDSVKQDNFSLANGALNALLAAMPEDKLESEPTLLNVLAQPWLRMMRDRAQEPEERKELFRSLYTFDRMNPEDASTVLELYDYLKAFEAGWIGEGELYKELLAGQNNRNHMRTLTGRHVDWINESEQIAGIRKVLIDRLLEIELVRGELPTEVTPLAMGLQRIEGMEYFVRILAGLDKETFIRGYVYGYGNSITKKESFSHLLKISHPREGEDAALLRTMLKDSGITEKRLLEAAMYAPQWIEIISGYLEWEGIRSAAWYFHAHINESFSAEKETVVAHYSPITPQDFNDGAFDVNWFRSAYETLGQKRFDLLYDCAKYISAGANHRRSQLFADATLGKLKLEEMKESVLLKRNKDHLLSYSLIPLGKNREQDIRERYELIQRFLAESKKFGAQRRASEGLAARIALGNLARNAGYADVTRLMWDIEARKLDELKPYFEPHALDTDTTAQLVIDEQGQSELVITSKGKVLKSVPARLKKDAYIEALKETRSELTAQFRRARLELERSMESGSSFTLQEINGLSKNPILAPLLRGLVLKSGSTLGYFTASPPALAAPSGEQAALTDKDELFIAHPLDLYNSGQWSLYQKDLFDRQLSQPFKQIFRELYLPNADELANGGVSRRYAGHQVQPRKTVALLRERQWTVSYEEGLQKVFYGENLIARLYAMADWFSPGDTEAPMLETVQFFDRTTYKNVMLDEVPPRLFSEVMRDVDLVVSVAHVGGVDPEASLTTVEMRRVIVGESLRLLKIGNVRVDGSYARIDGSLGEYAVHLGSGQVYKQASGALFIIPVHSQHRGRLFLPFLDEDPRTAEILSKVVLLAEDTKIKDPEILAQLKA
ncbi:DUF4132 domain-containing protein [Paenibacillus tritici]|uniref:DUF4132 domain-containing protein n=1 Tax=Paenibacillus tritici TaxID=1873425 RepID=UPI001BAC85F7|nr:DUF4132 domain-containing protein [Paenibacillus tritici]QUL55780.1 DUF4132 domain-containing protein [Paenibacillus tritici]